MKDNEKNRKLSESEQRRLRDYQVLCEQMKEKGYRVRELTVSIVKANLFVAVAAVPVIGLGMFLFFFFHRDVPFRMMNGIVFLFAVLALTVIHELIHGLTWSVFSKDHFKDIEFGFMKEYLTPYCTCKVPLKKKGYVLGTLMPLIVLGILPAVFALIVGNPDLLILGLVMILSAGGDVLIVLRLLRYKTDAKDIVLLDHPTQAGLAVFEK